MSCKQPSTLSKENGMFDLHFVHYAVWERGGGGGLMVCVFDSAAYGPGEARFSETPETFQARKAILAHLYLKAEKCIRLKLLV